MLMETGELDRHKGKTLDELMVDVMDDTCIISDHLCVCNK